MRILFGITRGVLLTIDTQDSKNSGLLNHFRPLIHKMLRSNLSSSNPPSSPAMKHILFTLACFSIQPTASVPLSSLPPPPTLPTLNPSPHS